MAEEDDVEELPREPDRKHLSVSQIGMYLRCARQYGYRYVKGIKSPPNWAMTGGRAMDTTLNTHHALRIEGKRGLNISEAQDMFRDNLLRQAAEDEPQGKNVLEETLSDGVKVLPPYLTRVDPYLTPASVQLEVRPQIAGRDFLGFVDMVAKAEDGHAIVYDHKFVSRAPAPTVAANSLQLRAYDIAVNDPTHHVGIISLIRYKRDPEVRITPHFVTPHERADLVRVVKWVSKLIDIGAFPMVAPTSFDCGPERCGYWSRCRGNPSGEPDPIPGEMEV